MINEGWGGWTGTVYLPLIRDGKRARLMSPRLVQCVEESCLRDGCHVVAKVGMCNVSEKSQVWIELERWYYGSG